MDQKISKSKRYVKLKELREYLALVGWDITRQTLRHWAKRKGCPYLQPGGKGPLYFEITKVMRWIENGQAHDVFPESPDLH
jgi:hypothetical protein